MSLLLVNEAHCLYWFEATDLLVVANVFVTLECADLDFLPKPSALEFVNCLAVAVLIKVHLASGENGVPSLLKSMQHLVKHFTHQVAFR